MAQLVAHLLCKQGVTGSSPVGSTTDFSYSSLPEMVHDGGPSRGLFLGTLALLPGHAPRLRHAHLQPPLAATVLARRYTPGVVTALPVVLSFWIVAKRTLRVHGIEVRPHRWVIPAFPVVTGAMLGSAYLVTTWRSGGHHRKGK